MSAYYFNMDVGHSMLDAPLFNLCRLTLAFSVHPFMSVIRFLPLDLCFHIF
jgi:hypothetical protein